MRKFDATSLFDFAHFLWPGSSRNFSFMSFAPFVHVIIDLDCLNAYLRCKNVYKKYLTDGDVVDWNG